MEAQQQEMKRKRRITKKKMKKKKNTNHRNTIFPLLLAAFCSKSNNTIPLIRKCLKNLLLNLPYIHLSPILSLLPSLLKSNCAEIACKSAEILGAASLSSLEMNEMIAAEDEIVKGLISLLRSPIRAISMAACNAILDLSTTSVGRQRLLGFTATENLLLCFIKESKSPAAKVCLTSDTTLLDEDEYLILLLQCAVSLINHCTIEQLQCIPTELSKNFSLLLKRLWGHAYNRRLCSTYQGNEFCISNIRTNNLVECIFRLSIDCDLHQRTVDSEDVKRSIFDSGDVDIEQFLSEIWETSPMLIRNGHKASLKQDDIFGPFVQYLGLKEAIPSFLPTMLKNIISCPAISSDEIDISHVINEIKNHIGHPIIYHQDIRLVKTQCGERELHYFQEQSDDPHILTINEILKCEEAFNEGYSIALRGLEFRYPSIADIADGLASLFGQPSSGINMYLTPANSQGLARHSDDHCVFVCQISGRKRWTVFSRPDFQLPRLYEPCDSSHDLRGKSGKFDGSQCQEFLLKEGDVLYIPRGSPHEAITDVNDDDDDDEAGFSLHLTLAVEIEPPFEWEGFMQIALYCWGNKQRVIQDISGDAVLHNLHLLSVKLVHIAIKLIGNTNPELRKASLVGAKQLSSDTSDWLRKNQKTTFGYLLSKITNESKFSDAVEYLEASLQKNEDPLEHIRWMKHLNVEEEEEREKSLCSSLTLADNSRYLFDLLIKHSDMAEATFMEVKSKFCSEVEFQNVEQYYKMLLEKYRKVRKQYSNGMLSLHSALHNEHELTSSFNT